MTTDDVVTRSVAAYDTHAADYAEWAAPLLLRHQMDAFTGKLPDGAVILDAGCGPGRDLTEFARRGMSACGADLSEEFVKLARAAGHTVWHTDLRTMPFAKEAFDGIWSCASLVHLPVADMRAALAEFARVTRPGGQLFLTVKGGDGTGNWEETRYGRRWFQRWQPCCLVDLVLAAGYRVDEVAETNGPTGHWVELYATRS